MGSDTGELVGARILEGLHVRVQRLDFLIK